MLVPRLYGSCLVSCSKALASIPRSYSIVTKPHAPIFYRLYSRHSSSDARSSSIASSSINSPPSLASLLSILKLDSVASNYLYAIFKLHNMPYLVTKGDKVYLPFKLKKATIGDELSLNNVVTLGSPEYTYNDDKGIPVHAYDLKATVVEITREPAYEVIRKRPRCRRARRILADNFQTVLVINELKLN